MTSDLPIGVHLHTCAHTRMHGNTYVHHKHTDDDYDNDGDDHDVLNVKGILLSCVMRMLQVA